MKVQISHIWGTFLLILFSFTGWSQTDCANPDSIANLPFSNPTNIFGLPIAYSSCQGNSFSSTDACQNIHINHEEYIFKYVPKVGESCITFNLEVSGLLDTSVPSFFVFDGCPTDATTQCIYQNFVANPNPIGNTLGGTVSDLIPGQAYYFVVSANASCYDFLIDLDVGACPPTSTLANCPNPTVIPALPYNPGGSFNSCGLSSQFSAGNVICAPDSMYTGSDYVFKYTPAVDECVLVRVDNALFTTGLFVFDNCPTLAGTNCVSSDLSYGLTKTVVLNLSAGTEYHFVVSTQDPPDPCGTFDFSIDIFNNDGAQCSNAIPLTLPASLTDQTTFCKDNNYNSAVLCGSTYGNGNEVVYTFNLPADACVGINVEGIDFPGGVFLKDACPLTATPCLDFAVQTTNGPANLSLDTYLSAGTYYIVVSSFNVIQDQLFDINVLTDIGVSNAGANCGNPKFLSSAQLPYDTTGVTTLCKNNDYGTGSGCISQYFSGHDYTYAYTSPGNECIAATVKNIRREGGIFITDDCPDSPGANCLEMVWCTNKGCDSIRMEYTITNPGTYYITVAANAGISVQQFDFTLEQFSDSSCTSCNDETCHACENAGFEQMSLDGWTGRIGSTSNPGASVGFVPGVVNQISNSRHTLMSAGSYDPLIGSILPVTPPNGTDYALRLGNRQVGCQAEMIEYSFVPDSNKNNLLYWYAVVLQDPNHTPNNQPFFMIRMFDDDTGTEIMCAHYEVRAGPAIPGFQNGPANTRWTNWTPVSIPLEDFEGQNIRIEFTNKDCGQCGHFGYSYMDLECGKLEVLKSKDFLCELNDTVHLTAPLGYSSYVWNTGETTPNIEVYEPGTYSVQMTTVTGCVVDLEVEVFKLEDPEANFIDLRFCGDTLLAFQDNSITPDPTALDQWIWTFEDGTVYTGLDSITHQFTASGTYTVNLKVINDFGCWHDTSITIDVDLLSVPPEIVLPDSAFLCEGDSISFDAGFLNKGFYNWQGPNGFTDSVQVITIDPVALADEGYYRAEVNKEACELNPDSVYLQVEAPQIPVLIGDSLICYDSPIQLQSTPVDSFFWTPGALLNDSTILNPSTQLTASQTFQLRVFQEICPDSIYPVDITVEEELDALDIPDTLHYCIGEALLINANVIPNLDYTWTGPNGFSESGSSSISIDSLELVHTGYYKVEGSRGYCPTTPDSTWVEVHPFPVLNIPNPGPICFGDTAQLYGEGAPVLNWLAPSFVVDVQADSIWVKPPDTTWYFMEGISDFSCISLDSVRLDVKPPIVLDLGPDHLLCETDSVQLGVLPGFDAVSWNTGTSSDSIWASYPGGEYIVDVLQLGCPKSDSVLVVFDTLPEPVLPDSNVICRGDTIFLDLSSSGAASVLWSDGDVSFTKIQTDSSYFKVDLINGVCLSRDSAYLDVDEPIPLSLPDSRVCMDSTLVIGVAVDSDVSVLWNTGETTDSILAPVSGTYFVDAIRGVCFASDTAEVLLDALPTPNLLSPVVLCMEDTIYRHHNSPIGTPMWSTGETTDSIALYNAGDFWVDMTNGTCLVRDSIRIIHQPRSILDFDLDTTVCETVNITIDSNEPGDYKLNGNPIGMPFTFNIPGVFEITLEYNACFDRDTLRIARDEMPVYSFPSPLEFCMGDSIQFSGVLSQGDSLLLNGVNQPSVWISDNSYVYLDAFRGVCRHTDSTRASIKAPPQMSIPQPPPFCLGDSVMVTVNTNADSVYWSTGEAAMSIYVSENQPYRATGYLGGCTDTTSVTPQLDYPLQPQLRPDTAGCSGISVLLQANVQAPQYNWNTGETTPSIVVSNGGDYWVDATNGTCVRRDSFELVVEMPPSVSTVGPTLECVGNAIELVGQTNAVNYSSSWVNQDNGDTLIVYQSGTYTYEVRTQYCYGSSDHTVTFQAPPAVNIPPVGPICLGDSVRLEPLVQSYDSLFWSHGPRIMNPYIQDAGNYALVVYDGPCIAQENTSLAVEPRPVLQLPADTFFCEGNILKLELDTVSPGADFEWENGDRTPIRLFERAGQYYGFADNGLCTTTDTLNVMGYPIPEFEQRIDLCPGDSTVLDISLLFHEAYWFEGDPAPARVMHPNEVHRFMATNEYGCSRQFFAQTIELTTCEEAIYVPNAFTPNGDGTNDFFFPTEFEVEVTDFYIFDRWGHVVYHTPDSTPWDGVHREGENCRPDVYVWLVRYLDRNGNPGDLVGHVVLIR